MSLDRYSDEQFDRRLAERGAPDDDHRRLVRMESKLTRLMRHYGVHASQDSDEERCSAVSILNGAVHATDPDVKVAWLYGAMLDEGLTRADLYVAGVYRGQIVLEKGVHQ